MTVELPGWSTRGQDWQFADYRREIRTGKTDGAGAGTVEFPAIDGGRKWEISRAVVSCAGDISPLPTCRFYVVPSGQQPSQLYEVSGTLDGLFDEAEYPGDGLWVLEGEQLLAVWTDAPTGQPLVVNLQLRLMVRN